MAVGDGQFLTRAGLIARMGRIQLERHLDDENTGSIEDSSIAELILDAEARVLAALPPNYTVNFDAPSRLFRTLGYDVAVAMLVMRHPEITEQDGVKLLNQALKELKALSTGETSVPDLEREDVTPTVLCEQSDSAWNDRLY